MMWTAVLEFRHRSLSVHIWRSDRGVWGYHADSYDGLRGYCFGLGRLLHVAWGELNAC